MTKQVLCISLTILGNRQQKRRDRDRTYEVIISNKNARSGLVMQDAEAYQKLLDKIDRLKTLATQQEARKSETVRCGGSLR